MPAPAGRLLDAITVEATAEGYEQVVEFADEHAVLGAWAIEGTVGYGAGLARFLAGGGGCDRTDRPLALGRNGAKPTSLTRIRAA